MKYKISAVDEALELKEEIMNGFVILSKASKTCTLTLNGKEILNAMTIADLETDEKYPIVIKDFQGRDGK